jgi:hypothetical protein
MVLVGRRKVFIIFRPSYTKFEELSSEENILQPDQISMPYDIDTCFKRLIRYIRTHKI